MTVDREGNTVVVVGTPFFGTVDFAGPSLTGPSALSAVGTYDAFVVKFDPQGRHVWSKRLGGGSGTESHSANAVTTDPDGNIFIAGAFNGTLTIPGIDANHTGSLSAGAGTNAFVAKLDPDGNHVWSHRYGATGIAGARAIALDGSGHLAVVGAFNTTLDFSVAKPLAATGGGIGEDTDAFVAELTVDGDTMWANRYGDSASQEALTVAYDSKGDLFFAGDYYGAIDFADGDDAGTHSLPVTNGIARTFLVKLDPNGHDVFSKGFGEKGEAQTFSVAVDHHDNVLISGYFRGRIDFAEAADGGAHQLSPGNGLLEDSFVAKFSNDGVQQWSHGFGTNTERTSSSRSIEMTAFI